MRYWKLIIIVTGIVLGTAVIEGCIADGNQSSGMSEETAEVIPAKVLYVSDTPVSECQLCGEGKGTLLPAYWGEDNLGIIDLNTFEFAHLSINQYDDYGKKAKPRTGSSTDLLSTGERGMSVWGMTDSERGYYSGEAHMRNEKGMELEKASKFLCTGCLNEILAQCYNDTYLQLGIVNFKTHKIRLLEKNVTGFIIDNFYIDCDYYEREYENKTERGFKLLIFHCPPRSRT